MRYRTVALGERGTRRPGMVWKRCSRQWSVDSFARNSECGVSDRIAVRALLRAHDRAFVLGQWFGLGLALAAQDLHRHGPFTAPCACIGRGVGLAGGEYLHFFWSRKKTDDG